MIQEHCEHQMECTFYYVSTTVVFENRIIETIGTKLDTNTLRILKKIWKESFKNVIICDWPFNMDISANAENTKTLSLIQIFSMKSQ